MRITLLITNEMSNQSDGRTVTLERETLVVGRERSDVTLMDDRCSRNHLALYTDKSGGVWVKDLGSTNGTQLNGRRISTCELKPGDVLRVGYTEIEVVEFIPTIRVSEPDDTDRGSPEIDVEPTQNEYSVIAQWPDAMTCLPKDKQRVLKDFIPGDLKRKHR